MENEDEVTVYAQGMTSASVCSSLNEAETIAKVNEVNPSGTESGWSLADRNFACGKSNPCRCNTNEKRQHFLLVC